MPRLGPTLILALAFAGAIVTAAIAAFPSQAYALATTYSPVDPAPYLAHPAAQALLSVPPLALVLIPVIGGAVALWWLADRYAKRVDELKAEIRALRAQKGGWFGTLVVATITAVAGFVLGLVAPFDLGDLVTAAVQRGP